MRLLDIHIGKFTIMAGHLQAGVPQHPLKAEYIATVSKEPDRCSMAQGMRRAPDSSYGGSLTIFLHNHLDAPLCHPAAVSGKKEEIQVLISRFGTAVIDVPPEHPLHFTPDRDEALLTALAHDPEHPLVKPQIIHLDAGKLAHPQRCIKQGKDYGTISKSLGGIRIDDGEKLQYLIFRQGGDYLLLCPG
jgi:hypothetical protein